MFIQEKAPNFIAETLMPNGSFDLIELSKYYNKKYVVLFFYPLDFTFVCPSEIIAFSKKNTEFKNKNTEVLGISVDSKFTHYAWAHTPIEKGGVGPLTFPLISDLSKDISKKYNVLFNNSISIRATFLIDKKGFIRHYSLNDLPLGRNIDEILRIINALQHNEKYGEVCPAGWNLGKQAIKPTLDGIQNYLKNNYKDTLQKK